ncbi:MAG: outer membrane lipoprotein-sorting protein [Acidobacteriota bacterium]
MSPPRMRRIYRFSVCLLAMLALSGDQPRQLRAASDHSGAVSRAEARITSEEIIQRVIEESRRREALLQRYSVQSVYRVTTDDGKVRAEVKAVLSYRAPGAKEFHIIAERGSETIRNRVIKPLMEVEVETAAGRSRHNGSITPANYNFQLLNEEVVDGHPCYVLEAIPRRADKYLFTGRIWIHRSEFSIVRIAGQPARNPSFWISRVEFVRRYQKIGEFWLPAHNESKTQVKLFGRNILTIEYDDYEISQTASDS